MLSIANIIYADFSFWTSKVVNQYCSEIDSEHHLNSMQIKISFDQFSFKILKEAVTS